MREFHYVITDPEGIHARPAGEFVKAAKVFDSSVQVVIDGRTADAKKIFGLMSLAAKCGDRITVQTEGTDEDAAAAALENFLKENL